MKVIDKIRAAEQENRCCWSFEYFPPKTAQGVQNLYDRMERMYALGPEFVDVTWGAGGTTADLTLEICSTAQAVYGLETVMHLTCTNMDRQMIDKALKEAKAAGIQNILALRGDPPKGAVAWEKTENGFEYAVDLVRYIRKEYGDYFCISVAGYPEGHIDSVDKSVDLKYLKQKIEAGADYIVTQMFFDVDLYQKWLKDLRKIGITAPVLPGIMPIQSYGGFKRMTTLCKTAVPQFVHDELDPIKDDDAAVKSYGVKLAVDMCRRLKDESGVRSFHFYTLNLEKSARLILEGLQFVADVDVAKPLPWQPSLAINRSKENVRPIFWKNRVRSYVLRTESWDEYPNGRWGDSRSPAYGELDGYGVSLKYTRDEALSIWGSPKSFEDVGVIFKNFCDGSVKALPWCDQPLSRETECIRDKLALLNQSGYLTINSQPPVNGVASSHAVFGWGPKNGYVYQKGYLEFFVLKSKMDSLIESLERLGVGNGGTITYYGVDSQGTFLSNCTSADKDDVPNAVTWGCFPGSEILQPTVADKNSFLAWKEEAFQIWNEWASIYESGTEAHRLLAQMSDQVFLINAVENDFVKGDIFKVFESILQPNKF